MAKFVCSVCGYVHEGDAAPEFCPICKAPAEKFTKQEGEMSWAAEHVVGVAQGAPEDIMNDLRMNYEGECGEVGMYLSLIHIWKPYPIACPCLTRKPMERISRRI